tara:strand:- start:4044 stop:4256 length:213 start_codon:yes stop_codon:yes gene_type:complete
MFYTIIIRENGLIEFGARMSSVAILLKEQRAYAFQGHELLEVSIATSRSMLGKSLEERQAIVKQLKQLNN